MVTAFTCNTTRRKRHKAVNSARESARGPLPFSPLLLSALPPPPPLPLPLATAAVFADGAAAARSTLRSTAKVCEGTVPLPWRAGAKRRSVSPSDDVSTQPFFCGLRGDDEEEGEAAFPPGLTAGEDPAVGDEAGAASDGRGLLGLPGNAVLVAEAVVALPEVAAAAAAVAAAAEAPAGAAAVAAGAGGASVLRRYLTS